MISNLLPLGVQIYSSWLSDKCYQSLLSEYENNLAGYEQLYQNENFWGGSDFEFLTGHEDEILSHAKRYVGNKDMRIRSQWINIQSHDGFLPLHDHSGSISYVIYLKVPEFIQNYQHKRKNNDIQYCEGTIQFHNGVKNSLFPNSLTIMPKERMIIMFPSELLHYVYPFKDKDSQRVSISGNIDICE